MLEIKTKMLKLSGLLWSYLHLSIRMNNTRGLRMHTVIIQLCEHNISIRWWIKQSRRLCLYSLCIRTRNAWRLWKDSVTTVRIQSSYSIRNSIYCLYMRWRIIGCIKSVSYERSCLWWRICWTIIAVEWIWTIIIIVIIVFITIEAIIYRSRMLR